MAALVEMRNIVKVYPNGVVANNGVDFQIEKGEIHAIVGENGAGKTTLMKILYGSEQPTSGEIFINGEQVSFKNPLDAMNKGVGMVHHNFMQVPSFTVA
jgi:simple sugar transport system ATP-binding protein